MDALDRRVGHAFGPQAFGPLRVRAARAHRADVAGGRPERDLQDRHVELVVVGQHADRRALVDRRAREEAVRPLDDELVDVGEALARHELFARVADGHMETEEAADRRDRSRVVDGAEDVHPRSWRERLDEDVFVSYPNECALAAGEELARRAVESTVGLGIPEDELLAAGLAARDGDCERGRALGLDRVAKRDDELGCERVDEDVNRAPAREADLERLLVGDPVAHEPRRPAREDVLRLVIDGGLDAAARNRSRDVPSLRDREHGARLARRGAFRLDDGRGRGAKPVSNPPLERRQNVPHNAPRWCSRTCELTPVRPYDARVRFSSPEELEQALRGESYLADHGLTTAIFLALAMRRPLLLEGEAGVGKTEVAKTLARVLDAELIRLQCYEGIDAGQALYEWDYARQLLYARALQAGDLDVERRVSELYGAEFLVERPLLRALRAGPRAVLLIDELDRADDEFDAFLLELLSDYSVTVPELGTIAADEPPVVVVTSNRTRELHDALKRRCLYHWIEFPDLEREVEIIRLRAPGVAEPLAASVAAAVASLRELDLVKRPGVAEAIDWAQALAVLGAERIEDGNVRETLGWAVKNRDDLRRVDAALPAIVRE